LAINHARETARALSFKRSLIKLDRPDLLRLGRRVSRNVANKRKASQEIIHNRDIMIMNSLEAMSKKSRVRQARRRSLEHSLNMRLSRSHQRRGSLHET
jgi:hypothetical protein